MENNSRNRGYIFGGSAVVAEIRQPDDVCGILGSIALPVTGGCARVDQVESRQWDIPDLGANSFGSGSAFVSCRLIRSERGLATRSQFAAYVNGLSLFGRL